MAESEEELKSLLMRVKKESEKAGLKLNTQKTKMVASSPITSQHINREKVEIVTDSIFLYSNITVNSDCSHLFPWQKNYGQPRQHIQKQRHSFADKGPYKQRYSISSSHKWMWELDHKEGWAPKNWCFQAVVLGEDLKVLWTTRSNQSVLKEIKTKYSLEGLMM